MNFRDLGLEPALVDAMDELGFDAPTAIQAQAIPVLLGADGDAVGLAETGSGKTAAFGLPLLQRIHADMARPQGVVVCPTRELCRQITADLKEFAAKRRALRIIALYGGASITGQIRLLRRGPQVIVATPGRLRDLIDRGGVDLSHAAYLVLDEADEMLRMGFKPDIDAILGALPRDRRIWLFSATMDGDVAAVVRGLLKDPVMLRAGGAGRGPKAIRHAAYVIQEVHRYEALRRILDTTPDIFALVFCRTRQESRDVAGSLLEDGYPVDAIHSDLSQPQRDWVMQKFRQHAVRVLVATDVAARGLDVREITHIIHYGPPGDAEIYIHRSGRTGRAGSAGMSIVLAAPREMERVRDIEARRGIRFSFPRMPDGRDICEQRMVTMAKKLSRTKVNEADIEGCLAAVMTVLAPHDREALVKRFFSAECRRLNARYQDAEDIHLPPPSIPPEDDPATPSPEDAETRRFFINIGRLDKISGQDVARLVASTSGIPPAQITAVDLKREFSFFEVDRRAAETIETAFGNVFLDGRRIQVRKAFEKKKAP